MHFRLVIYFKLLNSGYWVWITLSSEFQQHDELKPLTKSFTDSLSELGNLKLEHLCTSSYSIINDFEAEA